MRSNTEIVTVYAERNGNEIAFFVPEILDMDGVVKIVIRQEETERTEFEKCFTE